MDIQKQSNKKNKRSRAQQQKPSNTVNKDLLRLQRPMFELKRSQQNQSQFVIRKLMAQKQKPQIGVMGRSLLLSRLQEMMPVFQKSNQDLQHRVIDQAQKIDAKLEQCESSSSDQQQDQQANEQNRKALTVQIKQKPDQMQIQQTNHNQSEEMQNQEAGESGQFLQINFLRYPYLNQEQLAKLQAQKMGQKKQQQATKVKTKKLFVEQIPQQQN